MSVFITGSTGMIGKELVKTFWESRERYESPDHNDLDLMDKVKLNRFFNRHPHIETVIHMAGKNGGIRYNMLSPADIFYDNTVMGLNLIHSCVNYGVKKLILVLPSCMYPPELPLVEENWESALPHPSVECHAFAKRNLLVYTRQIAKQYGVNKLKVVGIVFNNAYGPFDKTDLDRAKFVSAMITKIMRAKIESQPFVEFFGDGTPRRELIFRRDAANGIYQVYKNFDKITKGMINLGWGEDHPISEVATKIASIVGYSGEVRFDGDLAKNGQMSKLLNVEYMRSVLDWSPITSLEDGLKETIQTWSL